MFGRVCRICSSVFETNNYPKVTCCSPECRRVNRKVSQVAHRRRNGVVPLVLYSEQLHTEQEQKRQRKIERWWDHFITDDSKQVEKERHRLALPFFYKVFQPIEKCLDCGEPFESLYKANSPTCPSIDGPIRCPRCHRYWRNNKRGNKPLKRRQGTHRRRCRKYGLPFMWFRENDIFERDGWMCQHCGLKLSKKKRGSFDDDAPELDHIWPLSRMDAAGNKSPGHVSTNCQLLCRLCNCIKGDNWDENHQQAGYIDELSQELNCAQCGTMTKRKAFNQRFCSRRCQRRNRTIRSHEPCWKKETSCLVADIKAA